MTLTPPPPDDGTGSRQAGFLQVLGAVFSSFFGIRKKSAGERDMVSIKPLHLIVAALLGAAFLVTTLVLLCLAEGYHRGVYMGVAVVCAAVTWISGLVFARFVGRL